MGKENKVKAEETEEIEDKKEKKQETDNFENAKEIEELNKKLAEANDKYLRLAAEYDNYRKRSSKEKGEAYTEAYSDAVKAFLPVADSLDKALEFTPDDEGIKAISKQFYDSCEKIGVSVIESDGKVFDPELHNAIMHEDDETKPENTVTQTFMKGYKLGDKVIRHAMVKVAN